MPWNVYWRHKCPKDNEMKNETTTKDYDSKPTCDSCGDDFILVQD